MDTLIIWCLVLLGNYYFFANISYLVLLYYSSRLVKERHVEASSFCDIHDEPLPFISLIAPAYNEEKVILASVNSFLKLDYPNYEVVIINDGSRDETMELLIEFFALTEVRTFVRHYPEGVKRVLVSVTDPRLKVIDQVNTGKAQALNHGIHFSQGKFVCTVDADSILEDCSLKIAIHGFLNKTKRVMGVGGTLRILNGCKMQNHKVIRGGLPTNHLAMFQIVEYIRSFFCGRLGWEKIGGTALLPGAFTLFRKSAIEDVGGFDRHSITEDFEIVVRMSEHYARKKIKAEFHMLPAPVCWTFAPESVEDLYKQRLRWQRGLCQTIWKHRRLMFNPFAGRIGTITLPYMFIFEFIGPFIDVLAISLVVLGLARGVLHIQETLYLIGLGVGWGIGVTLLGIRLEETNYARHNPRKSRMKFIFYTLLENLGYRQFILVTRLVGTLTAFKKKTAWGEHKREEVDLEKDLAA